MKLLLYCVKAKPYLADFKGEYQTYSNGKELDELWDKGFNLNDIMNILNGKIVAECDFEVEDIETLCLATYFYKTKSLSASELEKRSCLSEYQLQEYFREQNFIGGYAIHIKNLHIFDKPKELSEYYSEYYVKGIGFTEVKLRTAPQNMQYCYNVCNQKYILISIRPEWICKILNGEKTIEVRKKVLKEMIQNE